MCLVNALLLILLGARIRLVKKLLLGSILGGILFTIRADAILAWVAGTLWTLVVNRKRIKVVDLIAAFTPVSVVVLTVTAWRYWYFGDVVPNTYYLKATGYLGIELQKMGMHKFISTFKSTFAPLVLALIVAIFSLRRRERAAGLMLSYYAFSALYNGYVGGDVWETPFVASRFLAPSLAGIFVLATIGAAKIGDFMAKSLHERAWSMVMTVALLAAVIPTSHAGYIRNILKHTGFCEASEFSSKVPRALFLAENTPKYTRVAVAWAGVMTYFSNRFAIDILGKNDRVVAKMPAQQNQAIGHNKHDLRYSIGVLRPDIIEELWQATDEDRDYVEKLGYRKGSMEMYFQYRGP